MKLWQKSYQVDQSIDTFTVGDDRELDLYLAKYDVLGSLAHTHMLEKVGLLSASDLEQVQKGLKEIYNEIEEGNFTIEPDVEDIHSQVELLLTRRLGDVGKKIHSGRSRNDQVLVDIKMFLRSEVMRVVYSYKELFDLLQELSNEHKDKLLPGYTHLQLAMPSSFGMWFGAYAEAITDDMEVLLAAYNSANKNPLGSAAGYGSTFPLDRQLTTDLLGFETLNYNAVFAQMSRGKTERNVAFAIAAVAGTLSKLAYDVVLYMNQNFGFISFPDELTTGSSIMPHKKNPDVFELVRGKCNVLQSLPNELMLLTSNLPSGYHRDLQLTKDVIFPAFNKIVDCINITTYMLSQVQVKEGLLDDEKYDVLFSVDAVNNLVVEGKPFRDAYKIVGGDIAEGKFKRPEQLNYQHLGSIGNLANDQIAQLMEMKLAQFSFDKVSSAIEELVR
ncbi:argininosuccinate lyase [Acetobacteroides hydrogenigenes]|uniref:Argininosuccinate lyase n=1 Tax=Acetobacteroides hydrogenigenes TaxID=979970 RepID=A0A4R2ENH0_9BACT|nr:argininosuccinate lyase [Acetobacteroides hydrogenigenes]TCN68822.1 argininosuccinate lyase [Acetobacteroides hydrogenigenes]